MSRACVAAVGLAALALSLCGCNVAIVAGIVLGVSSGSRSSRGEFVPPAPKVTGVSPPRGSHGGGMTITVTGTGFTSAATVTVGEIDATDVAVESPTELTAVVPRSSTVGPVSVTVTDPRGGEDTLSSAFTYTAGAPAATIARIPSPQSGNLVVAFVLAQPEGDPVDLAVDVDTGSGFQAVAASRVLSGPLTGFATTAAGTDHTITLDLVALLGQTNFPSVVVRLTPTGEVGPTVGAAAVSNVFPRSRTTIPRA